MRSPTVSTKLQRIASQAADYPQLVFTTLAHLIDVEFLREAFRRIRKSSSPGLDKVTAKQYAEDLEENLVDLHERMRSGSYKAPPVVRVWLEDRDYEGGQALWRGHVTHVVDGERVYFQNPRRLVAFLAEYMEGWND